MIQKNEPLSSKDFKKGLVTRSDILNPDPEQSPNCMDVKWFFDGAIGKRLGSSTTNTVSIGQITGIFTRNNEVNTTNLTDYNLNVPSVAGIRGLAPEFYEALSLGPLAQMLVIHGNSGATTTTAGIGNLSLNLWVYPYDNTQSGFILQKGAANGNLEYRLRIGDFGGGRTFRFSATDDGTNLDNVDSTVFINSLGVIGTRTWYNVSVWYSSASHIGISVNTVINTASFAKGIRSGTGPFILASANTDTTVQNSDFPGRIDELGIWNKVLSAQERADLYAGGSGNTYSRSGAQWLLDTGTSLSTSFSNYWKMDNMVQSGFGWAASDFGAGGTTRWLTVAAGTGIYASSNLGTTFVAIASSRTETYQYLDRSKNVLIATSDAYDPALYWAGSAGTFASALAPGSAPAVKYSINYQGFLILLNSALRRRGFFYADENLQLTDPWTSGFDLPSSADDEITAAFVLSKFLYVSTRYRIFFVSFVGGNPDWTFRKVKDWGFVPRTVGIATVKGSQVAVGMDWHRRIRVFDGYDDLFVSDNIENYNNVCDFAIQNISYAGSGLTICHASVDLIEQEYRLNVAIGAQSSQTTHAIVLNLRTLAMYPYSNQNYNVMCIAESNNQQHLMALDRSGFVHILNSGNLDVVKAISENYDSPILFKGIPGSVSKSQNNNLYFESNSCGLVYYQDALNRARTMTVPRQLINLTGNENVVQVEAPLDVPATFNTYQFRLISSGSTANPWKMSRWDFLQNTKGIGKG